MSETSYFWQGGRKIEVEKDDAAVTIHADNEAAARSAADRAGVDFSATSEAAPGLVHAEIAGDRDRSMERVAGRRQRRAPCLSRPATDLQVNTSLPRRSSSNSNPTLPTRVSANTYSTEHLVVEREMGDRTFLVRVTDSTGRNPIQTANAAASRDDVEYAEPNLVRRLVRFAMIPPDTLFSREWHLYSPAAIPPNLVAGAGSSRPTPGISPAGVAMSL